MAALHVLRASTIAVRLGWIEHGEARTRQRGAGRLWFCSAVRWRVSNALLVDTLLGQGHNAFSFNRARLSRPKRRQSLRLGRATWL